MDHFNIPIGLIIGMCFVFSLLTNGQTTAHSTTTTASTTTASTGCKTAETSSPPEEGCTIVCGNQIYQAYTQICGSRRKRLASGTSTIFSSLPDKHFSKEFHILRNVPRKKKKHFFVFLIPKTWRALRFSFHFIAELKIYHYHLYLYLIYHHTVHCQHRWSYVCRKRVIYNLAHGLACHRQDIIGILSKHDWNINENGTQKTNYTSLLSELVQFV